MQRYKSDSEQETKRIAAKLAKEARGNIYALTGELGAGKTIFVQGFAKCLGIKEKIISPTFVLMKQHQIPGTKKGFYHIDLYRLEDISGLGLDEILSDRNNIVLIEWAEKLKTLPKETVKIEIQKMGPYSRLISISKDPNISLETRVISL